MEVAWATKILHSSYVTGQGPSVTHSYLSFPWFFDFSQFLLADVAVPSQTFSSPSPFYKFMGPAWNNSGEDTYLA